MYQSHGKEKQKKGINKQPAKQIVNWNLCCFWEIVRMNHHLLSFIWQGIFAVPFFFFFLETFYCFFLKRLAVSANRSDCTLMPTTNYRLNRMWFHINFHYGMTSREIDIRSISVVGHEAAVLETNTFLSPSLLVCVLLRFLIQCLRWNLAFFSYNLHKFIHRPIIDTRRHSWDYIL